MLLNQPFDPHQEGADFADSSSGGSASASETCCCGRSTNFLRGHERWPDLALFGQIELPTGNKHDLLGKGETSFRLMLIASRQFGWLAPHLNLGYEISTGPAEMDNLRYVAGVDARLHRRLTVALDAVGVYGPNVKLIGNHVVDAAVGVRWKVFRSLILNANVQVPVNRNQGLRPDVIWSLGFDYTFGGE